ncbi:MAG TPA: hypothetical protein VG320_22415 [Paraburkholderia sp.]|jgi:hypothetical protein|uniref:DUF4177 domain-containing protein n=1 Tax=Paraburkholderia eburnea TaxID=1189126 RepID=A0A2S4MA87_9BURK|nr:MULTISPECIES: hypothetical protein [Burkholderiaceae]NIE64359.1 hypothetical protein [Burkholderia sp. Ax-1719]POR51658.1 hypothetical protein B0G62_106192 [Paraburkholderia eburnea]PRZ22689.1 hypothetical protein BX588_106192 [Paraburkholderia eburnea]HEV3430643.1 hypothetical protein [Paraburkholderia sp.]
MYKFITIEGACGKPYDTASCERHANRMAAEGYWLVQVYQSSTATCGGSKSVLVMVFRRNE